MARDLLTELRWEVHLGHELPLIVLEPVVQKAPFAALRAACRFLTPAVGVAQCLENRRLARSVQKIPGGSESVLYTPYSVPQSLEYSQKSRRLCQ